MSATEYSAYRRRLVTVFALRIACAGVIIYVWDDLGTMEKAVAIVLAIVVVPGLTTVRRLFVTYQRYLVEGLPGEADRR